MKEPHPNSTPIASIQVISERAAKDEGHLLLPGLSSCLTLALYNAGSQLAFLSVA